MDLGLTGRVAIVAAASKGLGRAVAAELAREGADVTICARSEAHLAAAVAAIREATGRTVASEALDVTDAPAVARLVEGVERRCGRVDICVINAGGPPSKTFLETSPAEWRAAVDLTLMSAVSFAREVLPRMQKNRWGRLVTITSISVKQPLDGLMLSNSIRAGVAGMARTLANEFGPHGITVNNVCPGYTLTERIDGLFEAQAQRTGVTRDAILSKLASQIPAGRLGQPEEFAAMVAFLVSARAGYINGASIPVDGGFCRSLL
jgi:3-oxoacyl-[acyl-carrier protein] reductase